MTPFQGRRGGPSNDFSIGWGNRLRELVAIHPVDAHSAAPLAQGRRCSVQDGAILRGAADLACSSSDAITKDDQPISRMSRGAGGGRYREVGLEAAVALDIKAKSQAAEGYGIQQWRPRNILDAPEGVSCFESTPNYMDQIGMVRSLVNVVGDAVFLARWRCADQVESSEGKIKSIALDEQTTFVAWLWPDVNSCHIEAGAAEALRGPASAAEQIQSFRHICSSLGVNYG